MQFLVTEECGRLARWLRLMGYDAAISAANPLSALYRTAYNEGRVIVTRNRRVGVSSLFRVIRLESPALDGQLRQVIREASLAAESRQPFTRCDLCNRALDAVEKPMVRDRVPPYVFQTQERFYTCPSCRRVYWAATHWARACAFFEKIRS